MMTRLPIALAAVLTLAGCATGARVGAPAPNFTATTTSGDEVSLASLRGQVTILDFWAVW